MIIAILFNLMNQFGLYGELIYVVAIKILRMLGII